MPSTEHDERESKIPFFANLIATGFFSGYIPWASGTFGTIVGILLYLIPGTDDPVILAAMIGVGFFVGVRTSRIVATIVGNKLTRTAEFAKASFQPGLHATADPSIVVIDEIVGVWITLLFLPKSIVAIVCAFFFFRICDILKPPPSRQLENVAGGWGIMLDDVIAGMYANIGTRITLWLIATYLPSLLAI
jgi:phosphatidylglycerophosphatase A